MKLDIEKIEELVDVQNNAIHFCAMLLEVMVFLIDIDSLEEDETKKAFECVKDLRYVSNSLKAIIPKDARA